MTMAPEIAQDRDLERKPPESAAPVSPITDSSHALGGFLAALGSDGSEGGNSHLVSNPVMRHPANGEVRILAMRRAQQGVGNHKAQQLVTQLQRSSLIQRQCSCGGTCDACQEKRVEQEEPKTIQRQEANHANANGADGKSATGGTSLGPAGGVASSDVIPADSPGQPLDRSTREYMEPRFGADFSDVRVHTDSRAAESADALAANAYTTGREIYFAAGKYAPSSQEGQRLLAHELTHTVQQRSTSVAQGACRSNEDIDVGRVDDPLELEADGIADAVVGSHGSGEIHRSSDRGRTIRGDWKDYARAAWEGTKSVAGGAWEGTKWVGGKVAAGGKWLYGQSKEIVGAAWECAKATGRSIENLLTFDIHSVADLLGVSRPTEGNPNILDTIFAIINHPCLRMIPGYTFLANRVMKLKGFHSFLKGVWLVTEHPEVVINGIKASISGMIGQIVEQASIVVNRVVTQVGDAFKGHVEGIWRHLEPKLEKLRTEWWDVIKETAWSLVWPWDAVGKELKEMWAHLTSGANNLWDGNFSRAADDFLAFERGLNSVAGLLYGWFLIAAVLIGAIIGAIFGGGAGAIPGAAAGFKVAMAVGEGLLIATVAIETLSIFKAAYNLIAEKHSQQEKEDNYEIIAGSGLTLAITGVMYLLGELAVRFARGVYSKVAGLFKKPQKVPLAPGVETPKVETPKVEGPREAEAGRVEPETEARKGKAGEEKLPSDLQGLCVIGSLRCPLGIPKSVRVEVPEYPHADIVPEPKGQLEVRGSADSAYAELRGAGTTYNLRKTVLSNPDTWTTEFKDAIELAKKAAVEDGRKPDLMYRDWPKGKDGKALEVHHRKPIDFGGDNSINNLIVIEKGIHSDITGWWRKLKTAMGSRFSEVEWGRIIGGDKNIVFDPGAPAIR